MKLVLSLGSLSWRIIVSRTRCTETLMKTNLQVQGTLKKSPCGCFSLDCLVTLWYGIDPIKSILLGWSPQPHHQKLLRPNITHTHCLSNNNIHTNVLYSWEVRTNTHTEIWELPVTALGLGGPSPPPPSALNLSVCSTHLLLTALLTAEQTLPQPDQRPFFQFLLSCIYCLNSNR